MIKSTQNACKKDVIKDEIIPSGDENLAMANIFAIYKELYGIGKISKDYYADLLYAMLDAYDFNDINN